MIRIRFSRIPLLILFLLSSFLSVAFADPSGIVTWVYDGDTLEVSGTGTVRLIGVDTPEKEDSPRDDYYLKQGINQKTLRAVAREALQYNIRLVKGKRIVLSFDGEEKDRHGRTLAYVYLPDGRMLNLLLVEEGLAAVYRKFDFTYKEEFLSIEKTVRNLRKGIWR